MIRQLFQEIWWSIKTKKLLSKKILLSKTLKVAYPHHFTILAQDILIQVIILIASFNVHGKYNPSEIYQRVFQNPDGAFFENSKLLKGVNFFCKTFYFSRLTGFWIRLCIHFLSLSCFVNLKSNLWKTSQSIELTRNNGLK